MNPSFKLVERSIGKLRIYVSHGETNLGLGFRSLFSRASRYELVQVAKADGIVNAVAHPIHFGFTRSGAIQTNDGEYSNPQLSMYVEPIVDTRTLRNSVRGTPQSSAVVSWFISN
jgi:hypothetical protein